jgi:hypothetical protein
VGDPLAEANGNEFGLHKPQFDSVPSHFWIHWLKQTAMNLVLNKS